MRKTFVARLALAIAATLAASGAGAALVRLAGNMSGLAESPVNASPGTGIVFVEIDTGLHTLHIQSTFSGLTGTTTAAHIHCCTAVPGAATAGVATTTPNFVGFPLGVTSGSFDQTYDLTLASSWNPAFVNANGGIPSAEMALINGALAGRSYFNIHTTTFGGGEIRSFLAVTQVIPEPGTLALLALGLGALGVPALRRRG